MTGFDAGERRSWTGRAEAYARSYAKLCAYPVPRLLDAAGVHSGVRLLDVGTGTGTVASAAVELGAAVTAVDAQPDMVAWTAGAVPEADVHVGALPTLPFDAGVFDASVGNFVLNHVGQPRAALAELARVTRPGGRIALHRPWPRTEGLAMGQPDGTALPDVRQLRTSELLSLYSRLLTELVERRVVRSRNAPAGDLAETLAEIVYAGRMAPQSEKSWDIQAADGRKIQVKCRVLTGPSRRGSYSPFRSRDFDACVFVIFDSEYEIQSAVEVSAEETFAVTHEVKWVNGHRVALSRDLLMLPGAKDLTDVFRSALGQIDGASSTSPWHGVDSLTS